MVDKERCWSESGELVGAKGDLEDEVYLAQDSAKDSKAAEEGCWYKRIAAYANIKGPFYDGGQVSATYSNMSVGTQVPQQKGSLTIARLVEAVIWVAIRGEDGDLVSAALQSHSSIDHKALGAANAEVWVKEHDVLSLSVHLLWSSRSIRVDRCKLSWGLTC